MTLLSSTHCTKEPHRVESSVGPGQASILPPLDLLFFFFFFIPFHRNSFHSLMFCSVLSLHICSWQDIRSSGADAFPLLPLWSNDDNAADDDDGGNEEKAENEEKYEIDDVFRDISASFHHELW